MAIFFNQATLTYNGNTTNSNIAYGEILEALSATKTALEDSYTSEGTVTYVVSLRNTGTAVLTGLTVTDDLGSYPFNGGMVYPLTYIAGSAAVFTDGIPQPVSAVMTGPPLVLTGITVNPGGSTILIYQTRVNDFADPAEEGTIVNTVTVTGGGLSTPVTATATVGSAAGARLTITKSISPVQVVNNDRVTYTFVIRNFGNEAVVATDNATITDDFDPILTALAVTFEGTPWTQGVQYNYNAATGLFTTVPSRITVPAATYTRDPVTGTYTVIPGTVTLTVTGTI